MVSKKLGVLGGMGPLATSVFFERVIKRTRARCDQDHIEMVILNHTTLPDRTKSIKSGDYAPFLNAVQKDFEVFEALDVSHIAIPCNTSHFFYEAFVKMTKIPIIHMVEETVKKLSLELSKGEKIGVLATDGTMNAGIYKKFVEAYGLEYVAPLPPEQKKVMDAIYALKAGDDGLMSQLDEIIQTMLLQKGCSKIILACTELSLLDLSEKIRPFCIDAMDVLVNESIRLSGKEFNVDSK